MPNRRRVGVVGEGSTLIGLIMVVLLGTATHASAGPPCPCPAEIQVTKGDQYILIEWDDPPEESLYSTEVGTSAWTGYSIPVASGFRGSQDNTFQLTVWSIGADVTINWTHDFTSEVPIFNIDRHDTTFELAEGVVVSFPLTAEVLEADAWGDTWPSIGGFYLGADSALYAFRALSSGTVADSAAGTTPDLRLYWQDSVSGLSDTLTIVRGDSSLTFHRGLSLSFAEGDVSADSTFMIRAMPGMVEGETFQIEGEAFSGYKVWRSVGLHLDYPELVRKLEPGNPADSLFFACDHRVYIDGYDPPFEGDGCTGAIRDDARRTGDVNNAFAYFYGVTTFDEEGGVDPDPRECDDSLWTKVYPSPAPKTHVSDIRVRPNPYNVREIPEDWEQDEARIVFEHLPSSATIYVYNVSGELVVRLKHDDASSDFLAWDLTSAEGRDVVSGVYLYKVESNAGNKVGKFIVIR